MRKTFIFRALAIALALGPIFNTLSAQNENSVDSTEQSISTKSLNNRYGEMEDYRRSSLALIMITHKGTKYAQEMEEQFKNMPMPSRYNEHNIDIRVIPVSSKIKAKDVAKLLEKEDVAKKLVSRWFNRDSYSGQMNMDLIHARGGYAANYKDFMIAENTVRGRALLTDEGIELLKNTFVLVCDMDYYDRAQTGQALSIGMAVLAAGMNAYSQDQARKGNRDKATLGNAMAGLSSVGSVVAQDIAGFSVKMSAYLFRLKWDNKLTQKMYQQYWVDASSGSDASSRISAYNADRSSFKLEYLGEYSSRSGKTVSKSSNDLNQVIRNVCATTIDRGMQRLSKMFPVFKPKTCYQCMENNQIAAYIGNKEGITYGQKYEILETIKKKDKIKYKTVGKAVANKVWNNREHNFATDGLGDDVKGTMFKVTSGKNLCGPNYVIREAGKLGYSYKKKNSFIVDLTYSALKYSKSKMKGRTSGGNHQYRGSSIYDSDYQRDLRYWNGVSGYSYYSTGYRWSYSDFKETTDAESYRLRLGWMIDYGRSFAWNPINIDYDISHSMFGINTGFVLRTKNLGKSNISLFIWPIIGYLSDCKIKYSFNDYLEDYTRGKKDKGYGYLYHYYPIRIMEDELEYNLAGGFDWQLRLGINITPKVYIAGSVGQYQNIGITAGYMF